jgi:hypothetical protein
MVGRAARRDNCKAATLTAAPPGIQKAVAPNAAPD